MNDPRRRSFTHAVHVSGLGFDNVTKNGIPRLEGTPRYDAWFGFDAGDTAAQIIGIVPQGAYIYAAVNALVLTSGTVALALEDPEGVASDIALIAAGDLTVAAPLVLTGAFYTPLDQDWYLKATVTAGTAGETADMALNMAVKTPKWF